LATSPSANPCDRAKPSWFSTIEPQLSRKSAPKETMYFARPKSCAGTWSSPKTWRFAARIGS
jgi:hypothetical protein